ncbi:MAG: hypothetical protein H7Z14_20780, partial [Anaerolineae bacterium]|nr:hypothetical protein [Phycisphaerae bacterium]
MFKSAYFRRLFLPYLLLICGAMLVVGLLAARRLKATYLDRTAQGIRDNSTLVAGIINPLPRTIGNDPLTDQIKSLGRDLHCRITIMSVDGTVIADSGADARRMENHRFRPEVIAALAQGDGVAVRRSDTLHEDMLYFAKRVSVSDSPYLLRLSVHLRDLDHQLTALHRNLLLTGLFTTAIAG